MIATLDTKNNGPLTLSDIKPAIFNGSSATKSDLDVLRHIVDKTRDVVTDELVNSPDLLQRFNGRKRFLRREIDGLLDRSRDELQHLAASREFEKKTEKKGIVTRMLNFARKHKFITALLVIAAAAGGVAGGFYLTGNWELLMSNVALLRRQLSTGVGAALPLLDSATQALPGTGAEGVPGGTGVNL